MQPGTRTPTSELGESLGRMGPRTIRTIPSSGYVSQTDPDSERPSRAWGNAITIVQTAMTSRKASPTITTAARGRASRRLLLAQIAMITSSEARALGISNNELVQFARMGKLQRLGQGLYRVEWYSHPTSASYALGRRLPRQAMSVPSQPVADSIRSCMTRRSRSW